MNVKILLTALIVILWPVMSLSAISFTDGKWETTFDCDDMSQADPSFDCDGMGWGGNWTFAKVILTDGSSNLWTQSSVGTEWYYTGGLSKEPLEVYVNGVRYQYRTTPNPPVGSLTENTHNCGDNDSIGSNTVYIYSLVDPDLYGNGNVYSWVAHTSYIPGDYVSSITSSANNNVGLGGKGFREIDGDGITVDTGPLGVTFQSKQKELWIRWYMRYEVGYNWEELYNGPYPFSAKHMYLFTGVDSNAAVCVFRYREISIGSSGGTTAWPVETTGDKGWPYIMGVDPETGGGADGLYHCYEMYVKMDTNSADGIGRIWVDGELLVSNTSVDWSGGTIAARDGWQNFKIGENQGIPKNNGAVMAVDYDDIVVYNTTPPGRDANNNPYIGPIASSANPIVEILTASGQTTTASIIEITGTATADTGLTIAGVTCPGQTVTADDGIFDEFSESWTCQAALSVGSNNLTFTAEDSTSNTGTDSVTVTRTGDPTSHSIGKGFYSNGINFK